MSNPVKLEVITPSKQFYSGNVELVIVRTLEGDEGYMAGHAWGCKLLDIGELWIQEEGKAASDFKIAAISGGYVDIKDSIIIYTDAAEWPQDINKERALSNKTAAEDWLTAGAHDPNEIAEAKITIAKAVTRMNVAEGGGRKKR